MIPKLESERLVLRAFLPTESSQLYELFSDERVLSRLPNVPSPYRETDARDWIDLQQDRRDRGQHGFAVALRHENKLIGGAGLKLNPAQRHAEASYWLAPQFWGQGYAAEALRLLLRYGFDTLNVHRVYAYSLAENERSERLLKKCGFLWEGTMREHIYQDGRYKDAHIWGLLAGDQDPKMNVDRRAMRPGN